MSDIFVVKSKDIGKLVTFLHKIKDICEVSAVLN